MVAQGPRDHILRASFSIPLHVAVVAWMRRERQAALLHPRHLIPFAPFCVSLVRLLRPLFNTRFSRFEDDTTCSCSARSTSAAVVATSVSEAQILGDACQHPAAQLPPACARTTLAASA